MLKENFVSLLETTIKENIDLPALSDYQEKNVSFGEMGKMIVSLHQYFKEVDIKKGDKISIVGRNSINWSVAFLATISYGAVAVPILTEFSPADIENVILHSDSKLLFIGKYVEEKINLRNIANLVSSISLEEFQIIQESDFAKKSIIDFKNQSSELIDKLKFPIVTNDDIACIFYTSGTTSASKGVVLNHNSIIANVIFARNNMPLKAGEQIVSFLPLAHAFGCAFEFLFPLSKGCHITYLGRTPSPKIIMEAFQAIKPQLILSVPLVIEKIYKNQIAPAISKPLTKFLLSIPVLKFIVLSKIRKKLMNVFGNNFYELVIGGSALNAEVEQFFRKINFPFTIGYGMTECGPLISYSSWKDHKLKGVGKLIDYLEIKVDSPNPQRIVGEILVKGENVMLGYYKNQELSSKTIVDGWLKTGDLGLIDKNGFIFLKGRSKTMILGASGQNIYPEEIEARINNISFVQESLVLEKENRLFAFVFPDLDLISKRYSDQNIDSLFEEKRKHLNHHLPSFSQISKIIVHNEEFIKTPTKKIKRFLYYKDLFSKYNL